MSPSLRNLIALPVLSIVLIGCTEAPPCNILPGLADDHHGNAVCYVANEGHILLIERRFFRDFGLPGGRRGAGERSQCTAARETWEETGLTVIVGPLLERASNTSVYLCGLAAPISLDADLPTPWEGRIEIAEARWVPFEELDSLNWRYTEQHIQIRRLTEGTSHR